MATNAGFTDSSRPSRPLWYTPSAMLSNRPRNLASLLAQRLLGQAPLDGDARQLRRVRHDLRTPLRVGRPGSPR